MGVVYICKNKINNKVYVGQTVRKLKERIYDHLNKTKLKKNNHFHNALKKHGKENFVWEILEENIKEEDLDDKEIFYIKKYESYKKEKGYNSLIGGKSNRISLNKEVREKMSIKRLKNMEENRKKYNGFAMSPSTREKMSKSRIGTSMCEGAKEKLRKANIGKKKITKEQIEKLRKVNIGKRHKEESKIKMSESKTGEKNHFFGKNHSDENNKKNRISNHNNGPNKMNSSGFKGVSKMNYNGCFGWRATIRTDDGKRKFLGFFDDPIDAAKVYDNALINMFGEENVMTNKKLGLLEALI